MKTAHVSTTIARTPEEVFDYMLDPATAPAWRYLLTRLEPVDATPLEAGSRARIHFELGGKRHEQVITLTECVRPVRQTWVNDANGFLFSVRFTLSPTAGGTNVTIDAETRGTRWSTRPLVPLVIRSHRERFANTLHRLKQALESKRA